MINKKKSLRDTHVYMLSNEKGKAIYYGTTNNIERRENEHRRKKEFKNLVKISKALMTKKNAEKLEKSLIRKHKKSNGSLPKLNISPTGKYEYGILKNPKKKKEILSKVKKISKAKNKNLRQKIKKISTK